MAKTPTPGLYIDADMRELEHATGVISTFFTQMNTEAHVQSVIGATHTAFAKRFDQHMKLVASTNPENFHHVYEYSLTGDGYRSVGNPQFKLWQHTIRKLGRNNAEISWNWKPATKPNPTYSQRRNSTVGYDAIREIPQKQYRELLAKSKKERYTFIWKAPMLEYNIRRSIAARGKAMIVPVFGGYDRDLGYSGATKLFRKFAVVGQQQPGNAAGMFTAQWTYFWGTQVENEWDEVIGGVITRDAAQRVAKALNAGKRARRRQRRFALSVATDNAEAFAAGQQQAISAFRGHNKTIKAIENDRGRWSNVGG